MAPVDGIPVPPIMRQFPMFDSLMGFPRRFNQPDPPANTDQLLLLQKQLAEAKKGNTAADAANGGDPILTTLLDSLRAPAETQLPAQYSGGRVYVQAGSAGNPALLWVFVAIAAGVGVWYFKQRQQ